MQKWENPPDSDQSVWSEPLIICCDGIFWYGGWLGALFGNYARYLVHRPFSEQPFSERPISEWPIFERPIPEGDNSPNDHSPKATILRTTNLRKRPVLGRLIIAEATMGAIFAMAKNRGKCMTQQIMGTTNPGQYTVSKLLHILPDFLSMLHLIFHLCNRRQVLNIWIQMWLNLGLVHGL
jgi:hypothetical protein